MDLLKQHCKSYKIIVSDLLESKNQIPFNPIKVTILAKMVAIIENSNATESQKAVQRRLRILLKINNRILDFYEEIKKSANIDNKIEIADETLKLQIEIENIKKYIY